MAIDELIIIGEWINYNASLSFEKKGGSPTVRGHLRNLAQTPVDERDFTPITKLAIRQAKLGVQYIDVNVDVNIEDLDNFEGDAKELTTKLMEQTIVVIQDALYAKNLDVPLCIDSADPDLLKAGYKVYNLNKFHKLPKSERLPILNSVTESNADTILSLGQERNYQVVLNLSERGKGESAVPNKTTEETYETAERLFAIAKKYGFATTQIYIDTCINPIVYFGMVKGFDIDLEIIEKVNSNSAMKGVHKMVGLSNLTKNMERKESKPDIYNGFLTLAMERGLDTIIGSASADYEKLEDSKPIVMGMKAVVKASDENSKYTAYATKIVPKFLAKEE